MHKHLARESGGMEGETCNITTGVWHHDSSVWPHTVLLRIRRLHLNTEAETTWMLLTWTFQIIMLSPEFTKRINHEVKRNPKTKWMLLTAQNSYLECNMILRLVRQNHRTGDLLLQFDYHTPQMQSMLTQKHHNHEIKADSSLFCLNHRIF